jgi:hypothetical protein
MALARRATLPSFGGGRNAMDDELLTPVERGVLGWSGVWKKDSHDHEQ